MLSSLQNWRWIWETSHKQNCRKKILLNLCVSRQFSSQLLSMNAPAARLGSLFRRLPWRLVITGFTGSSEWSLFSSIFSVLSDESSPFIVLRPRFLPVSETDCWDTSLLRTSGFLSSTGVSSLIILRGRPLFLGTGAAGLDSLLAATSLLESAGRPAVDFLYTTLARPIYSYHKNHTVSEKCFSPNNKELDVSTWQQCRDSFKQMSLSVKPRKLEYIERDKTCTKRKLRRHPIQSIHIYGINSICHWLKVRSLECAGINLAIADVDTLQDSEQSENALKIT